MATMATYVLRMKRLRINSELTINGERFAVNDEGIQVRNPSTGQPYWTRLRLRRGPSLTEEQAVWLDVPAMLDEAHPAHLWQMLGQKYSSVSLRPGSTIDWRGKYYTAVVGRKVTFRDEQLGLSWEGHFIRYAPEDSMRLHLEKPSSQSTWNVYALKRIRPSDVTFD